MIICRIPYRCSIFGGSTDTPSFYQNHPTFLINFALNKYCYVSLNETIGLTDIKYQSFCSVVDKVKSIKDLSNPGIRGSLEVLKQKYYPNIDNLSIYVSNQIPDRTGLGTSSSLVAGVLKSVHALYNNKISKKELARETIYVERIHNKEVGGIQDEIAVVYGGFNQIEIAKTGDFTVKPMGLSQEFLNLFSQSSLLFYTNKQRNSFEIAKSIDQKSTNNYKLRIRDIALEAKKEFENENIERIGKLIAKSWEEKKSISNLISNNHIDNLVETLIKAGCYGVRLLGSGGAGFLFCLFDPKDKEKIIQSVDLKHIETGFDFDGAKIIFNERD